MKNKIHNNVNQNKCLIFVITFALLGIFLAIILMPSSIEGGLAFTVLSSDGNSVEEIKCWRHESGDCYVFIPGYAELQEMQVRVQSTASYTIDGVELSEGLPVDFIELNTPYSFRRSKWGIAEEEKITFIKSSNVNSLFLDTSSGDMDYIHGRKGNEEAGSMRLYSSDGSVNYAGAVKAVSGRGNSSWANYEKKPYNLDFSEDVDLIGSGATRKWVLLANANDASNLRNKIVFDIAREAGLDFTPDAEWVDLYLNGEYAGLYLLSEKIEPHAQSVNISADGSFLVSMELQSRLSSNNNPFIVTDHDQVLRVHYNQGDTARLENIWSAAENAILSESGIDEITGKEWKECIDVESWVKKYIIEELFCNIDAGYISQFFYSNGGGSDKIYAGPVWDYDHAIGDSRSLDGARAIWANRLEVKPGVSTPWLYALCQKSEFSEAVVACYRDVFLPLVEQLLNEELNAYAQKIEYAAAMNQIRWLDEGETLSTQTAYISEFMAERKSFLSSLWIEQREYNFVRVGKGSGVNYAYYAVEPGGNFPEIMRQSYYTGEGFQGWFYEESNEAVDLSQPVCEDVAIYGTWSTPTWMVHFDVIVPSLIIAAMFFMLLFIAIKRAIEER